MKRIVPCVALAVCVAALAEAATAPASNTASSSKPKSTSNAARTTPAPKPQAATKTESGSSSQMDLGFRAIGGSLGFVSPEGADGTFTLGVFADCGRITPNIALEPRLDYWSWSEESFGAEAKVRDIIFGARGKYLFETANPKFQPFAGAGLSMHFLHTEVTTPAFGGFPEMKVEDSTTKLGLDLGGGVSTPIGPRSDLLAEGWYGIVSDVSQFSLRVGMSYRLGM